MLFLKFILTTAIFIFSIMYIIKLKGVSIMKTIGDRIRDIRETLGLTGEEFGRKLNVAKGSVSNWENNKRTPDADMLVKIADLGKVTTDYILCRTDNKESFSTVHNVNGSIVKITADKRHFPDGINEKSAAEYLEAANMIKELGLTREELNMLVKLRHSGMQLKDLELVSKLRSLGIKYEPDENND